MVTFRYLLLCVFSIYIIILFGTQTKKDNWLLARLYERFYPDVTFQQMRRRLFIINVISGVVFICGVPYFIPPPINKRPPPETLERPPMVRLDPPQKPKTVLPIPGVKKKRSLWRGLWKGLWSGIRRLFGLKSSNSSSKT